MNTHKVPKGLVRCEICGEYKGKVLERDLNEEGLEETEEGNESIEVLCLCEGILCPKCKKNKIHRPISNYYDERTGEVFHRPWFSYMMPCDTCRKG